VADAIGICGAGRMGAAISRRLLGLGRTVAVWNRTPARAQPLAALGARLAATPAELVEHCDIVLSLLSDEPAIGAVYHGEQGLLAGPAAGRLFIEMSTVQPRVVRALAAPVRARGAALVDCPVGGSTVPAQEGKLLGLLGGEAADAARARDVLALLCRRIEHVGPLGAGASVKLAVNLPLLVYWQALGEALALCRPLGLEPGRLMDILGDTSGAPAVLKVRGPSIVQALRGDMPAPVTFDIDSVRKDLRTMVAEADALGIRVPAAAAALAAFEEAVGAGAQDCVTLTSRWASGGGR